MRYWRRSPNHSSRHSFVTFALPWSKAIVMRLRSSGCRFMKRLYHLYDGLSSTHGVDSPNALINDCLFPMMSSLAWPYPILDIFPIQSLIRSSISFPRYGSRPALFFRPRWTASWRVLLLIWYFSAMTRTLFPRLTSSIAACRTSSASHGAWGRTNFFFGWRFTRRKFDICKKHLGLGLWLTRTKFILHLK